MALHHIKEALRERRFSVVLLHGVTGSGKTEVYLQAIDEALKLGRGAIVLVPEISLTPQTVEGFKSRFAENVAVLHSRLSAGERLDEWEKLREGKARVVVGARSAVFAPIRDLGLIVVDEEHEHTYKQEETPRYHARDLTVMRGTLENATVILGSATPSLESSWNAAIGKYRVFHLPRRIQNRPLPGVAIVDMREEIKRTGKMSFFSRRLLGAMEERLAKGEQVILFLNRRGFSPIMICRRCGFVQKCPHCSVSLTTHHEGGAMVCHLCGYVAVPPDRCPSCRSPHLRFPGLGTQKLELMVSKLFPEYRVGRMDTDSMTGKDAHAEALGAFRRGELRILLGTQMIAKGLHFPNVTLVGVMCADTALHLPDFRAAERTFQLLTQVAGRAGRGEVHGEVIVQTYAPNHPAIIAAGQQDYEAFYRQEIRFRQELGYPPVKRFVVVTLRGRNGEAVRWIGTRLAALLKGSAPPEIEVLGPAPAPIARARGQYRWQLILKGESVLRMNAALRDALGGFRAIKGIQIVVDADPVSML
jgi:primosomal protein N' (replication factor Y)